MSKKSKSKKCTGNPKTCKVKGPCNQWTKHYACFVAAKAAIK